MNKALDEFTKKETYPFKLILLEYNSSYFYQSEDHSGLREIDIEKI
jgi:hypothetical protein